MKSADWSGARAAPLVAAVLCVRAAAGSALPARPAAGAGYAEAYLGTVALSLQADPLYGSRLLDSFDTHLRSVAAMTAPRAVAGYLEASVVGADGASARELRASLGKQPLAAPRAAALLLAHALARPERFQDVLDGLEARKPGLGRSASKLLREVGGTGSGRLIAALRAQGAREPGGAAAAFDRFGRLDRLFDGSGFGDDVVDLSGEVIAPAGYDGYGSDGRPRPSGLRKPLR